MNHQKADCAERWPCGLVTNAVRAGLFRDGRREKSHYLSPSKVRSVQLYGKLMAVDSATGEEPQLQSCERGHMDALGSEARVLCRGH